MNVGKVLKKTAEKYGEKAAIIFEGQTIAFKELQEKTNRLANALIRSGIKRGDKVGIWLPNSLECAIGYLAVYKIGAVVVPLDARLKETELIPLLNHSKTSLLISRIPKEFSLDNILEKVSSLKNIITVQEGDFLSFEEIMKEESDELSPIEIDEKETSTIFYTSGTTGTPKGVVWNYRHLDAAPKIFAYFPKFTEKDVEICPIPFSHCAGLVYLQVCIFYGGTLVLMRVFSPLEFLKNIEKYQVTWFHIVPSMFTATLQMKEFETYNLKSLRAVAVFGAPSSPGLLVKFAHSCPQAKLFSGYGLTETAPPNTMHPLDKIKLGSVGKTPPWIEMKIFDKSNKEVPTGEVGEVVFKGWVVMDGYYKEPQLTSEVIKDGWFYTGDLGKVDEEDYLYIMGRTKEVIIVGGLNVYAVEVEGVIQCHPKVKEVAVVGIPDKLRGEVVKAVVVLREGEKAEPQEIIDYCRRRLTHFKIPHIVEFRGSLPHTSSGKIRKEELK
ncbi:MAG: AMP-binding protein [Candidatus Omnitrophica bacterium]|nr:AMP-binding protein [Candidatus Omnitrophota bacterium]